MLSLMKNGYVLSCGNFCRKCFQKDMFNGAVSVTKRALRFVLASFLKKELDLLEIEFALIRRKANKKSQSCLPCNK